RCAVCRNEVASLTASARELVQLAPVETPPPGLWDRVLERIRSVPPDPAPASDRVVRGAAAASGQVWKARADSSGVDRAGFLFVGMDDVGFEPTGFEGIEARRLFVDHD